MRVGFVLYFLRLKCVPELFVHANDGKALCATSVSWSLSVPYASVGLSEVTTFQVLHREVSIPVASALSHDECAVAFIALQPGRRLPLLTTCVAVLAAGRKGWLRRVLPAPKSLGC